MGRPKLLLPLGGAKDAPSLRRDPVDASDIRRGVDAVDLQQIGIAFGPGGVGDDAQPAVVLLEFDHGEHLAAEGFVADPEDKPAELLGFDHVRKREEEGADAFDVHGEKYRGVLKSSASCSENQSKTSNTSSRPKPRSFFARRSGETPVFRLCFCRCPFFRSRDFTCQWQFSDSRVFFAGMVAAASLAAILDDVPVKLIRFLSLDGAAASLAGLVLVRGGTVGFAFAVRHEGIGYVLWARGVPVSDNTDCVFA